MKYIKSKFAIIITIILLMFSYCEVVSAAEPIVFNGDSIENQYIGSEVMFQQTLYVCGKYSNGYGRWLYLSYERVRDPEEVTIPGTAAYDSVIAVLPNQMLVAYCPDAQTSGIRLGATFNDLVATVTAHHSITIYGELNPDNNTRPTSRPDVGDARLIICNTNLEYFCAEWQGTYGAASDEQFARQCVKTGKALANISADIYAVEEIQQSDSSLRCLTNLLNARTAPGRYSYVDDGDTEKSVYSKVGFIYRTDKVTPVLALGHPYTNNILYLFNQYVQAFEEISTGERFVLSVNHFASKLGDTSYAYATSNAVRMSNVRHLADFLNAKLTANYYEDEDVLIVGDLNCNTMEEPIRFLDSLGYENLTMKFSPTEYSYVYDNNVSYLDHAFASPTLSGQITGAAPYHINADENGSLAYYYSTDTSMYRYSDHDPIIIGLTLSGKSDEDSTRIGEVTTAEPVIISGGCGRLSVRSETAADVAVYDLAGREIAAQARVAQFEIALPKGVYIVRFGKSGKKVVVW